MNRDILSNDALRAASAKVIDSLLDSLHPPSQCVHEFSPEFEKKMRRLCKEQRRHVAMRKFTHQAAAVFVAMALSFSAWLTFDTEARAEFFGWLREVYEDSIIYRFAGEHEDTVLPSYELTWIPEGFELVDGIFDNPVSYSAFYLDPNTGNSFLFEYSLMFEGTEVWYFTENDVYVYEQADVNGIAAEYYQAVEGSKSNNLLWIDENIVFTIDSDLEKDIIFRIAEGVNLTNSTK